MMRGKLTPKRLEKFMADYWDGKLSNGGGNSGGSGGGGHEEL